MELLSYERSGAVATITMDDGKVNCLSRALLHDLGLAFDRAASDDVIVVLTGRPGQFSAGFDLAVLRHDGEPAHRMFREGFKLAERLLSHSKPVVVACSGHAIGMGAFLLLCADLIGQRTAIGVSTLGFPPPVGRNAATSSCVWFV